MLLPRRAGEDDEGPVTVGPHEAVAVEATADELRREVLVRDGHLTPLPTPAQLHEERHEAVTQGFLEPMRRQQPIQRGTQGELVEPVDSAVHLVDDGCGVDTSAGRDLGDDVRVDAARGLRDGHTLLA